MLKGQQHRQRGVRGFSRLELLKPAVSDSGDLGELSERQATVQSVIADASSKSVSTLTDITHAIAPDGRHGIAILAVE